MNNDADQILDDLLSRWHAWQKIDHGVRGYNHKALLIGDSRAYRVQYEAQLERQDDEHDALRSKAVNFAVRDCMVDPYRTAIYMNARNLYTGHEVWISHRLPQDKAEREEILEFARGQLTRLLISSGVM